MGERQREGARAGGRLLSLLVCLTSIVAYPVAWFNADATRTNYSDSGFGWAAYQTAGFIYVAALLVYAVAIGLTIRAPSFVSGLLGTAGVSSVILVTAAATTVTGVPVINILLVLLSGVAAAFVARWSSPVS